MPKLFSLGLDGRHRVAAEGFRDVWMGRLAAEDGHCPRKFVEVECILDHVEPEPLPVEAAVRKPVEEGVAEDVLID